MELISDWWSGAMCGVVLGFAFGVGGMCLAFLLKRGEVGR